VNFPPPQFGLNFSVTLIGLHGKFLSSFHDELTETPDDFHFRLAGVMIPSSAHFGGSGSGIGGSGSGSGLHTSSF
jgi:hypothetical protein